MSAEHLSMVDKVLAYVSSPFRLFAMVLMAVLTFSGYFVYQNQELLIGAYKESKKIPSIAEDRVEDAAAHLGSVLAPFLDPAVSPPHSPAPAQAQHASSQRHSAH
jgi:hypothetical protein